MTTWQDLQNYARENYSLTADEDAHFLLTFALDDDRSHPIQVRKFKAFDRTWIEFRSPVCRSDEMTPLAALRRNNEFVVGALVLDEDMYYLVHNAALATLDMTEFELPLHVVSQSADRLESEHALDPDRF